VCRAVDLYLKTISDRGDLTADMYRRIVEAVPDKYRTSDDTFFNALRGLLISGQCLHEEAVHLTLFRRAVRHVEEMQCGFCRPGCQFLLGLKNRRYSLPFASPSQTIFTVSISGNQYTIYNYYMLLKFSV